MVQPEVLLGLDLGASKVAAVVGIQEGDGSFKVTGAAHASPNGGIRQGEIKDIGATVAAITQAVNEALRVAGQSKPEAAMVSIDGSQFKGVNLKGAVNIPSQDRVITVQDRDRLFEEVTSGCKMAREDTVLHKIPLTYHIKGQKDIKNPVDMVGDTLEAEVRIIVAPGTVLENINRVLYLSNLQGARLCYSPLASAKAVLTREDRENGAVVIDIGHDQTHLGVFREGGALCHSAVIPVSGADFTRDLEISIQVGGLSAAEQLKWRHGSVLPEYIPEEELVPLEDEGRTIPAREIAIVLRARAVELFTYVLAELNQSGVLHEIHGGVHLIGGGAILTHMPILAQQLLRRPRVVLGRVVGIQASPQIIGHPHYPNALGAIKLLQEELNDAPHGTGRSVRGIFSGLMKKIKNSI